MKGLRTGRTGNVKRREQPQGRRRGSGEGERKKIVFVQPRFENGVTKSASLPKSVSHC